MRGISWAARGKISPAIMVVERRDVRACELVGKGWRIEWGVLVGG